MHPILAAASFTAQPRTLFSFYCHSHILHRSYDIAFLSRSKVCPPGCCTGRLFVSCPLAFDCGASVSLGIWMATVGAVSCLMALGLRAGSSNTSTEMETDVEGVCFSAAGVC